MHLSKGETEAHIKTDVSTSEDEQSEYPQHHGGLIEWTTAVPGTEAV